MGNFLSKCTKYYDVNRSKNLRQRLIKIGKYIERTWVKYEYTNEGINIGKSVNCYYAALPYKSPIVTQFIACD